MSKKKGGKRQNDPIWKNYHQKYLQILLEVSEMEKYDDLNVTMDIDLDDFFLLPEFRGRVDPKATRIKNAILFSPILEINEIRTLRDLKDYIDRRGWLLAKGYTGTMFKNMGIKSVYHLNSLLKEYRLEPIDQLYKD